MNFFKKFNFNKNILAFSFTSILSLIVFFYNDDNYLINIKGFIFNIYENSSKPSQWYRDLLAIKEENELLSQELVQVYLLNSKLINYEIENKKLRDMLNLKDSFKNLTLLPANIIESNYFSSIESRIINVGIEDGIKKDLPVIDIYGNLIGKIIETTNHSSKVQLITDNNFSVSVKVGTNISIGQFRPTYYQFGVLDGIIKSLDIDDGDIVFTSGVSEIYPPDIPLAKVKTQARKKNKLFQEVGVSLLTDIDNLYYVFIIQ
tara:strand:+ start:10696 stop:11478 length:783 start_codon:yes stop_codon:yes gene_type:complete